MEKFRVFIRRFAGEDDIRITVGVTAAQNSKSESQKIVSDLNTIEQQATSTMESIKTFSTNGANGLTNLKNAVKDLLKQSQSLGNIMTKIAPGSSSSFNTKANKLTADSSLKQAKIGFTGGQSDDSAQLLKEAAYLKEDIFKKTSLIRQEEEKQLKTADQLIASLTKEAQLKEQQSQQKQVQVAFESSYTDLGGADLTAQYREEYAAIMQKLTAEQQELVVKKLMSEENKKLVNSTVAEIQALKEGKLASTGNVSALDKLRTVVNGLSAASEKAGNKFKEFIGKVKKGAITFRIIGGLVRQMFGAFMSLYDKAASYEEAINLYRTSFGDYAEEADKWAERISSALYLDPKDVMQYAGSFYNLTKGLGVSSDAAYLMATNLTQLSYDMSSFLNIGFDEAQAKIQSAITGQARAVASAGVAMQQASLQELAYTMGITKEVSEMNQREKTYLRYIQIMKSTANMQQDLGKTIITPQNALRVIKNQFEMLGRAIGQVFIPIVMKVIPYIMVLTQALQRLASKLASLLGFKIADVDYSSITTADTYLEGLGNTADDTAGKVKGAAGSINRSLAPFDNLNVVESESAGSGGTGGVGVGGDDVSGILEDYLSGYDMLGKLTDEFNSQLDTAKEKLKDMLPWVIGIGTALLAWKLSTDFMKAIIFVSDFMKAMSLVGPKITGVFSAIGGFLMGIPMIGEAVAAVQLIGTAIGEMAAGTMTLSEGFAFIGSALGPIAAAIGGILAIVIGIVQVVSGIKDIINGNTFQGILKVIEGIALVVAGVALLMGGWVVAAIAAVVAVVAVVVEHWEVVKQFFVDLWEGVKNGFIIAWEAIVEFFTPVVEWFGEVLTTVGEFFVEIWQGIVDVASTIADWFNDNVIKPVVKFFTPLVEWFAALFTSIWATVSTIWYDIGVIICGVWLIIKEAWSRAFEWFKDTVLTPIWNFFKDVWTKIENIAKSTWEKIKGTWEIVSYWFNETIITPVANFFTTMWTGLVEGAKWAWEGIKKAFAHVATFFGDVFSKAWEKVRAIFSIMGTVFKGIAEGIFKTFAKVVNWIIDGINDVVSIPFKKINEAFAKLRSLEIFDLKPFGFLKDIPIPQIPNIEGYATGGYPDSGDLFFANENGRAEYITSVGNRTAVANQDQMIAAISTAITQSMSNARNGNNGIIQVYIGDDKVYEGHGTYQNRQSDRYGTTYVQI